MASGVRWQGASIADLISDTTRRRATLAARVRQALQPLAADMEAYAKANHPWQNQTGEAERRLKAEVEQVVTDVVSLVLAHGVDYGVWLETRFGGRYAILGPTIEVFLPQVHAALRGVVP